jgi:hypothetical protein
MLLLEFGVKWQNSWTSAALSCTKVFSYRGSRKADIPEGSPAYEMDAAGE